MSATAIDVTDEPWAVDGPWTVDDLARLPEDGQRYEIIDGGLLMSPPPAPRHQGIAHRLTATLNLTVDSEWEALEAVGILLRGAPDTRMLIPDVVVAASEAVWTARSTLRPADIALAVEVVSPSSVAKDRVLKPTLLAEAGVPAYWRVEQGQSGPTVLLHRLTGAVYKEEDAVRAGEVRQVEWPVKCRLAPHELAEPK